MFKFSTLFVTVEELGNKVFGFLRNNIIPEPLVHDVIILLPVFHNFFQVLLTLHNQHVNNSDILDGSFTSELLPQNIAALVDVPGKVEILDHEGDVAVPGLVQAQHPHLGVQRVAGQQGLHLPGHCSSGGHCNCLQLKILQNHNKLGMK